MKTELKLHGVEGVLETLRALPAEVVSKRGGPARAALAKGARVIQRAAKANVIASADEDIGTGLLAANIVASRGKPPSDGNGERYLVRVRRKAYKRSGGGETTTTLKTAQLKEYGSSQQQAEPWLRPAFAMKAREAIETVRADLLARIDRLVRSLAKAKGGR